MVVHLKGHVPLKGKEDLDGVVNDVKNDERTGHPTTYGLTDMIKCMSDGSYTN
jgi:hypothetical protein